MQIWIPKSFGTHKTHCEDVTEGGAPVHTGAQLECGGQKSRQYLRQGVTGRTDTLQHDLHRLGQGFLGTQEHAGLHPKSCLWGEKAEVKPGDTGHSASTQRLAHAAGDLDLVLCHPRLTPWEVLMIKWTVWSSSLAQRCFSLGWDLAQGAHPHCTALFTMTKCAATTQPHPTGV